MAFHLPCFCTPFCSKRFCGVQWLAGTEVISLVLQSSCIEDEVRTTALDSKISR